VQVRDADADSGKEARMNRTEGNFTPSLFGEGGRNRVAIAIDIQEIGEGQNNQNKHYKNTNEDFGPKGETTGLCIWGRSSHGNSHSPANK